MKFSTLALYGVLGSLACPAAFAENTLLIDDFTTGAFHSAAYNTGGNRTFNQNGSTSHILGGNRNEVLYVCSTSGITPCKTANPYGQYTSVAVGSDPAVSPKVHALVFGSGFQQGDRLELYYGEGTPMSADLSPYSVIRVNFQGLSGPLNFNLEAWTGSTYAVNACNLGANMNPFSVEFPISGFSQGSTPVTWSDINTLLFIYQLDGVSFGISSIEASDTSDPNAVQCNDGT